MIRKILILLVIGLVTLTAVNTALAADLDNVLISDTHPSAHIGIELPLLHDGAHPIPINIKPLRAWNYVDIEIT